MRPTRKPTQSLPRLLVTAATLLALAGAARSGLAPASRASAPTTPVRLVSAAIRVDGLAVLRASTSDDGHPDADEVWGYLLESFEFKPTDDFDSLGLDPAVEEVTLGWLRGKATEHLGAPPKLEIEIEYGGLDAPFRLGLVKDPGKGTWRVARETVERRFAYRRITRRQAAQLTDPRREH